MNQLILKIEQTRQTQDVVSILEGANETLGMALQDLDPDRIATLRESIEQRFSTVEVRFLGYFLLSYFVFFT